VLVVPFLDLLKGQAPPRRAWAAAALAALGVAVLELGDAGGAVESLTRDDWLSLLQPVGFGIGFWRMEAYGRRFPRDALPLAAGQVTGVAVAASAWAAYELGCFDAPSVHAGWAVAAAGLQAAARDIQASPTDTAVVLATLAWTGFASTAATVLGESIALTQLSAAEATLIFSTEPLWGAAFAYAVLGETLGPYALVGGGLIVGTCLWNAQQRSTDQLSVGDLPLYEEGEGE
jgi:drug/metabolite transporter (DMT)-like permease